MSEPTRLIKELVDVRDQQKCVRCGKSLYNISASHHHRKLRSQATETEKHTPSNLILLCGSGTTGCHGWVHNHPKESYKQGWLVRSTLNPEKQPVTTSQYGRVLLTNEGTVTPLQKEQQS